MSFAEQSRQVVSRIVGPLLVSVTILLVFFFGGDAYQRFGLEFVDSTTTVLKNMLGVIGFVSLAVLVNRIIRHVVFDGFIASATGAPVPRLLSQISGLIIFVVAISACARIVFNQDLTFLWAASGVAGLVLGMALRELLQDVFAGIALNIDRAVRIGDWIQIHRSGDERIMGQLMEISWRTTRVKTLQNDILSFPNSKFSAFTISNFTLPEAVSRRPVSVMLDCAVPADQAFRILQAAALDALVELTGPGAAVPAVFVNAIKIEGVEYLIVFQAEWQHLIPATRAIQKSVLLHLARAGLRPAGHSVHLTERSSAPSESSKRQMAALKGAALFAGIPEQHLQALLDRSSSRSVAADRTVVQAGEAGAECHILLEGLLDAQDAIKLAGRAAHSTMIRPGAVIGARTALVGEPHRRTVRARTGALLLEIGSDAFARMFVDCPGSLETLAGNLMAMEPGAGAADDDDPLGTLVRHMRHMFPAGSAIGDVSIARH